MNLFQRAGRNIFWLFISEICARGFTFLALLYLARLLGPSEFGMYSLAIAMGGTLWGLTDAGVTGYGIREVAKNKNRAGEFLVSLNSMRICAAFSILVIVSIILAVMNLPGEKKIVLLLGSLYILAYSISPDWVFQGMEEMKYLSIGKLAISISFIAAVFVFADGPSDVFLVIILYSCSHLLGGVVLLTVLYRKFRIVFAFRFHPVQWWVHFKESFYFFLGSNITNLGQYIPIFVIGVYLTDVQLGVFAAAFKLIMIIFAVGNIVTLGIYPILSNLYSTNIAEFRHLHTVYQNLVLFIALPIAVTGMLMSDEIITLLYGKVYVESGNLMKVLVWLIPITLLRLNYGRTLFSANFHRLNSIALGSGVLLMSILCLVLVPHYNILGVCWAIISGESLSLIMMKWMASAKLKTSRLINADVFKILIASVSVGVVLLQFHFHTVINIILAGLCYVVLSFMLGVLNRGKIMKIIKE